MKRYRIWTKDFGGKYSILSDWQTRAECVRQIIARWGYWPPFVFVSQAKTVESFIRANGK